MSENTSELYWVDATIGEQESFASERPSHRCFNAPADAARHLVPRWQVTERPVDRGPLPLPLGFLLTVVAGLGGAASAAVLGGRAHR